MKEETAVLLEIIEQFIIQSERKRKLQIGYLLLYLLLP